MQNCCSRSQKYKYVDGAEITSMTGLKLQMSLITDQFVNDLFTTDLKFVNFTKVFSEQNNVFTMTYRQYL